MTFSPQFSSAEGMVLRERHGAGTSRATTDMRTYPPRAVFYPPSGLRVGDGLVFRVMPAAAAGVRIVQGVLEVRPPAVSLTAEQRCVAHINLDDARHKDVKSEEVRHASVKK